MKIVIIGANYGYWKLKEKFIYRKRLMTTFSTPFYIFLFLKKISKRYQDNT